MTSLAETLLVQTPPLSGLTEVQRCGRHCVWCGAALRAGRSVDLGERDDGAGRRIFPRACPPCTTLKAYHQLINHAATCEQCVDNAALCPASAGIRRALKEGRRQCRR
ncbi:hypothetical protein ACIRF8_13000 [Streptomyces sp. NPDC102406]|uniref:hypothetical protein n=1 Tax=Streptomyces sp. NPDC102406 TaxID=3366171 RepID=UPI00380175CF